DVWPSGLFPGQAPVRSEVGIAPTSVLSGAGGAATRWNGAATERASSNARHVREVGERDGATFACPRAGRSGGHRPRGRGAGADPPWPGSRAGAAGHPRRRGAGRGRRRRARLQGPVPRPRRGRPGGRQLHPRGAHAGPPRGPAPPPPGGAPPAPPARCTPAATSGASAGTRSASSGPGRPTPRTTGTPARTGRPRSRAWWWTPTTRRSCWRSTAARSGCRCPRWSEGRWCCRGDAPPTPTQDPPQREDGGVKTRRDERRVLGREKGNALETVISALESALAAAYKRQPNAPEGARVVVD